MRRPVRTPYHVRLLSARCALAGALIVLSLLHGTAPTQAATLAGCAATLAESPPHARAGSDVTVEGKCYEGHKTVTFRLDGKTGPQLGGTSDPTTDDHGDFSLTPVTIPSGTPSGPHTIYGTDGVREAMSSSFIVCDNSSATTCGAANGGGSSNGPGPSMQLSTQSVKPGDTVKVTGVNFPHTEGVTLYWDDSGGNALPTTPTSVSADDNGHFSASTKIPVDATAGGHSILAMAKGKVQGDDALTVNQLQGAQGTSGDTYCTGLFGWCPDMSGLIINVLKAVGDVFTGITRIFFVPIINTLTNTPNLTDKEVSANGGLGDVAAPHWADLNAFQGNMMTLAYGLVVVFFFVALLRYSMASLVSGDFQDAIAAFRRTIVVLVALIALPLVMPIWFGLVATVAGNVVGADTTTLASAWVKPATAPDGATAASAILASVTVALLSIPFIIGVIIVGIQRLGGVVILMAFYAMAPVCIVCWISPDFKRITTWWFENFVSYSLWGIGYSVILKVVGILLVGTSGTGTTDQLGDQFVRGLVGIASLFVLTKVPHIINSATGGISAKLAGATSAADAAVTVAGGATGIGV